MSRNRKVKLSALLPGRPSPLYATIFHAATKNRARECETSKIKHASDLLGALAVCDKHRDEVLEFVNIFQGLIIRQNGLALLTSMKHFHGLPLLKNQWNNLTRRKRHRKMTDHPAVQFISTDDTAAFSQLLAGKLFYNLRELL